MAKRKAKKAAKPAEDGRTEIEALRARHKGLNERRITAEADLKNATARLDELKARAREQYGTDDIDELSKRLEEMKAENERRRRDYEKHLTKIEAGLAKVEREHQAAEAKAGGET